MSGGTVKRCLDGLRVLELSRGSAVGYAGRLLACSGAVVTKLLWDGQAASTFLDGAKLVLTIANGEDVTAHLQTPWDVILWDSHVGGKLDRILCAYVSDPHSNLIGVRLKFPPGVGAEEHDLQAAAGWMALTGDPSRPPLAVGGRPASYLVGAHAATLVVLAALEQETARHGRLIHVNVLSVAVIALEGAFSAFLATGEARRMPGNRHHALTPMAILPAADGWVLAGAPVDEQWELLERWSGLMHRPVWSSAESRRLHCADLENALSEWTRHEQRRELFELGQTFRLPFAMVQSPAEVRNCPQLTKREFWNFADSGQRLMRLPWLTQSGPANFDKAVRHLPPQAGLPCVGLRILDLTSMWSGPYCTRLFADLGAEVIKVEAPHRLDGIRAGKGNSAPFFRELNRNKRGILLNLRQITDRQVFLNMVASCHVLVENFSPRVMTNLGLGREVLWARNPNLSILSLSAFGHTGPYRDYVGYGATLDAMSGLAALTQYSGGGPYLPGFSVSDLSAGIHGAFALAAVLFGQHSDRSGTWVDLSQYEAACQLVGDQLIADYSKQEQLTTVPVRTVDDLAADRQINRMHLPGGPPILGVPWRSVGWRRLRRPPPGVGMHAALYSVRLGEV